MSRAELEQLRRWKAEALPVIAGLQEVGRALGLRLGENITGRTAVDASLDLRNASAAARCTALVEAADVLDARWTRGVGGHPYSDRDRGIREAARVVRALTRPATPTNDTPGDAR